MSNIERWKTIETVGSASSALGSEACNLPIFILLLKCRVARIPWITVSLTARLLIFSLTLQPRDVEYGLVVR